MTEIETVAPEECERVLAQVLGPPGAAGRATRARARSFARYMSTCGLTWRAWRCRRGPRETALVFLLFLPGQTAIMMMPATAGCGVEGAEQRRLVQAVLGQLGEQRLSYVQALVEPEVAAQRDLLVQTGFAHLTQLIYLRRSAAYPRFEPPAPHEAVWLPYAAQRHDAFANMLLATYEGSRDCPELSGLRTVNAVIASHQAAGPFDPALWELAVVDGVHAGCILLSRLMDGACLEVVYMGVAAPCRQRGVGSLLLRRALQHCRETGARELTAAVDCRNAPARNLYARFGFEATARREAYLYVWPKCRV